MFILNILPILILLFYKNTNVCILSIYLYIYLYMYNFILNTGSIIDINIIIIFLNKLNSALYNPIIFLLICMLSSLFYLTAQPLNLYRNLLIVNIITFLTNSNSIVNNLILLYREDTKLASTLTNGLLIIHPLILYTYYGALLLFLFNSLYKEVSPLNTVYYFPFYFERLSFYKIGLLALLLGSWWSHQELNWGGFWSWDLVEIFLLIIVTYNVSLIHNKTLSALYFYKVLFFLLNFALYAISVRFNLINSIHNFFTQESTLYKITYTILFFFLVVLVLLLSYYKVWRISKVKNTWNYSTGLIELLYITLLLYVTVVYAYFYILKSSSIMLLCLVPTIIYTLVGSLVAYTITATQVLLPFVESLFLSSFSLLQKLNFSYIIIIHILILIFFLYTFVFFNINILLPIFESKKFVLSLSINNIAQLSSSGTWLSNISNTKPFITILNFNLFLENHFPNLRNSTLSLVTHSTPLVTETCGFTVFLHKLFIKVSFIDNLAILVLLILLVFFFYFYKSYSPIKNKSHY